ncbi:hypothetical protein [Candidatus Korobacter versatilis]|uniref:hypothetical protein n=1 Tax=Candidatus Korobacter versatilis TaxID=658062 RepID=UPI0005A4363A|nr:hypothetical protein [Candidatus Koribacter versatilis]
MKKWKDFVNWVVKGAQILKTFTTKDTKGTKDFRASGRWCLLRLGEIGAEEMRLSDASGSPTERIVAAEVFRTCLAIHKGGESLEWGTLHFRSLKHTTHAPRRASLSMFSLREKMQRISS